MQNFERDTDTDRTVFRENLNMTRLDIDYDNNIY